MDEWGWQQLRPWLEHRSAMPIGALSADKRPDVRAPVGGPGGTNTAPTPCPRRWRQAPFRPPQLRHAHAVEMAREGVPLNVIQRQLGHADLGVTSVYLQGIDNTEVISAVRSRQAPVMPASAGLLL